MVLQYLSLAFPLGSILYPHKSQGIMICRHLSNSVTMWQIAVESYLSASKEKSDLNCQLCFSSLPLARTHPAPHLIWVCISVQGKVQTPWCFKYFLSKALKKIIGNKYQEITKASAANECL